MWDFLIQEDLSLQRNLHCIATRAVSTEGEFAQFVALKNYIEEDVPDRVSYRSTDSKVQSRANIRTRLSYRIVCGSDSRESEYFFSLRCSSNLTPHYPTRWPQVRYLRCMPSNRMQRVSGFPPLPAHMPSMQ